jgi:hypothetical protein
MGEGGDEDYPLPPETVSVTIAEMVKNVMLNLFQHLMESITYETLARSDERT